MAGGGFPFGIKIDEDMVLQVLRKTKEDHKKEKKEKIKECEEAQQLRTKNRARRKGKTWAK